MSRLSDSPIGPTGKKLRDMTDAELREEIDRRRNRRRPESSQPTQRRVKQYLANLELSPGATWAEVERAYGRLRERYDPDKHLDHPGRHDTALELSESLTRAYDALREYFGVK